MTKIYKIYFKLKRKFLSFDEGPVENLVSLMPRFCQAVIDANCC